MDKRAIDEWAKNVPLVQRILNSMVHSSTGVRPSSIIYSEELDPSIIRSSRSTPNEDEVDTTGETTKEESSDIIEWEEEWISRLKESQKIYIERAIFLQKRVELIKIPPYRDPNHGIMPDGLSENLFFQPQYKVIL